MSRSPKLSLGLRNKSFLDIVTTSSWPPPLPQESASSPKANLGEGNEDDIGLLVDQSDPALEHLDRAYSESYKLHLSLKECRALVHKFRRADPENAGLTPEQFREVAGGFLASKTDADPEIVFAIFDTARSHRVTLREFLCGYAILCKGTQEMRIRYLFNMHDVNDMGKLSRAQLTAALNLIAGYAEHAESAAAAGLPGAPLPPTDSSHPPSVPPKERTPATTPVGIPASSGEDVVSAVIVERPQESCDSQVLELEETLVDGIVDGLLEGDDWISYDRFISICTEEETVMSWLDKLAKGCGELMEESVGALERHMVELEMVRTKVVPGSAPTVADIGSPPRPLHISSSSPAVHQGEASSPPSAPSAMGTPQNADGTLVDSRNSEISLPDAFGTKTSSRGRNAFSVRRSSAAREEADDTAPFIIDYDAVRCATSSYISALDYSPSGTAFACLGGRGSSATVWSGEWLHMPVAVKVFNDEETGSQSGNSGHSETGGSSSNKNRAGTERHLENMIAEAHVLAQIRHPNVCLFLALCVEPKLCVISELYSGGSVHDFLHGPKPRRFRTKQALDLITDVARGMVCWNVLVDKLVTHAVLCDFGEGRISDVGLTGTAGNFPAAVGTARSMAPEVMKREKYTKAADVYSFGIVAWEMWTGSQPFQGLREIQLMFMVSEGERPVLLPDVFPPTLGVLLEMCWAHDPSLRPGFDYVMKCLGGSDLAAEMAVFLDHENSDEEPAKGTVENASRELMDVVHRGDIDSARRLIAEGADVGYADYDARRPIHIACAGGHVDIVRLLLGEGASVNCRDRFGGTPLNDARRSGIEQIVNLVLAAEAVDADGSRPTGPSEIPTTSQMEEQARAAFDMMSAVFAGDKDRVQQLLRDGHDVNVADFDSRTPLALAVSEHRADIVSILLECGADVYAVDSMFEFPPTLDRPYF